MSESHKTRRRHPRKIAAWTAWVKFHRSSRRLEGKTANVSRGGAYLTVSLDGSAETGDAVSFVFDVPDGDPDRYVVQSVSGEATVVRVERGANGGVAIEFEDERDID